MCTSSSNIPCTSTDPRVTRVLLSPLFDGYTADMHPKIWPTAKVSRWSCGVCNSRSFSRVCDTLLSLINSSLFSVSTTQKNPIHTYFIFHCKPFVETSLRTIRQFQWGLGESTVNGSYLQTKHSVKSRNPTFSYIYLQSFIYPTGCLCTYWT